MGLTVKIPYDKLYEAFVKLNEEAQCGSRPVKHTGGKAGTAVEQTAREIVDTVYDLDNGENCPKFIVSSTELSNVPVTSISNSDVVPLGSRLEEVERTVQSLVKGFQDMKNSLLPPVTFASVASQQINQPWTPKPAGGQGRGPPQGGARPRLDSLSGRTGAYAHRERLA